MCFTTYFNSEALEFYNHHCFIQISQSICAFCTTKADKQPLFSKWYYWPTSAHRSNFLFNVIPHMRQTPLRNGKESTFASLPVKYIWVWTVKAINKIICSSLPLSHSIHSPLLIITNVPSATQFFWGFFCLFSLFVVLFFFFFPSKK